jgi:hypothetical protein
MKSTRFFRIICQASSVFLRVTEEQFRPSRWTWGKPTAPPGQARHQGLRDGHNPSDHDSALSGA